MTRLFRLIALFAALLLALPLAAQTFPALTGRVVDAANILPPADEAALAAKLTAFESETGRQMVVTTIPDLQGYPIEDYGYRLGRAWGIGSKDKNDGALLIVAPTERKVRIEVGYGLEPWLTDAYSSVIITSQIVPRFKAGDFAGGVAAGAEAMIAQLELTPEQAAERMRTATAKSSHEGKGAFIFWLFILLFFVLPVVWPMLTGRGRRGHRMGAGPIIVWGGSGWGGGSSSWGSGGGFGGGGFSGGGGSFGGGGASGGW